jgi:hypothetical protein
MVKTKIVPLIFSVFLSFRLFAQVQEAEIFHIAEQMPVLCPCDSLADSDMQQKCSDAKMIALFAKNIIFSNHNQLCTKVVFSFVINENGRMEDIKQLTKSGEDENACGEALLEQFNKLAESMQWIVALHKGKKVKIKMVVPIRINFR